MARRLSHRVVSLLLALTLVSYPVPGTGQDVPLTNADVIRLIQAGLAESLVVTAIRKAPSRSFDLSPAGLIELRQAGVPNGVLSVMVELSESQPEAATAPTPAGPAGPPATPPPTTEAASVAPVELDISHKAAECVVAERFPKLDACFVPASEVASAKLHFHSVGDQSWYYVEMKPEGDCFAGILPKPRKNLKRFEYYVEVTDRALSAKRSPHYSPEVAADISGCTKAGLPITPFLNAATVLVGSAAGVVAAGGIAGFLSEGVVAATAAGATAGGAGAAGGSTASGASVAGSSAGVAAGGGGIGTLGVVAIGAAVAAGGALAYTKLAGGFDVRGTWSMTYQWSSGSSLTATLAFSGEKSSGTMNDTDYDGRQHSASYTVKDKSVSWTYSNGTTYTGSASSDNAMSGTMRGGSSSGTWSATR